MPTFNTTPNRGYQEPAVGNTLKVDIDRLVNALRAIDTDVASALAAIVGKAGLASPAFTGTPTAPTAAPGTDSGQLATTAFVRAAVAALVDSSPGALDTLNELAAALGDDPNFAATMTALIGTKADDAATAAALAGKADKSVTVSAAGLATGGGDLSANRTITVLKSDDADAIAGSRDDVAMTPHSTRLAVDDRMNISGAAPAFACRAWVNFKGTGTVAIRASGNVSSITDNGTGDFTINFATALPDADYAVALTASGTGGTDPAAWVHGTAGPTTKTTSALRITTGSGAVGTFIDAHSVFAAVLR